MLVRALCLRRQGEKLTVAELKVALPMTGQLHMHCSGYAGRDGRGRQVCILWPQERSAGPLVELLDAKLVRIEPRGVLIRGTEDIWNRKRKVSYPQALWAWPAPPPAPAVQPQASLGSPDVTRLLEAIDALV